MSTAGPHEEHPTVEIPEAEKIAAEWEARHDVAARRNGHRHLGVQEYLRHERTEEARHQAEREPPSSHRT